LLNIRKLIIKKYPNDINSNGKIISFILQSYEDLVLKYIIKFNENNNLKISVLMFDGVMCIKDDAFTEEFLVQLEEYIFNNTTIEIKLKYKPMNVNWTPLQKEMDETFTDTESITENEIVRTENFSIRKLRTISNLYHKYDKKGKYNGMDWDDCPKLIEYMNLYFAQF
jgi:hypothetical protein